MGRQRFTAEQIIAKLREVDVIVGRGGSAAEPSGQAGIRNADQLIMQPDQSSPAVHGHSSELAEAINAEHPGMAVSVRFAADRSRQSAAVSL